MTHTHTHAATFKYQHRCSSESLEPTESQTNTDRAKHIQNRICGFTRTVASFHGKLQQVLVCPQLENLTCPSFRTIKGSGKTRQEDWPPLLASGKCVLDFRFAPSSLSKDLSWTYHGHGPSRQVNVSTTKKNVLQIRSTTCFLPLGYKTRNWVYLDKGICSDWKVKGERTSTWECVCVCVCVCLRVSVRAFVCVCFAVRFHSKWKQKGTEPVLAGPLIMTHTTIAPMGT